MLHRPTHQTQQRQPRQRETTIIPVIESKRLINTAIGKIIQPRSNLSSVPTTILKGPQVLPPASEPLRLHRRINPTNDPNPQENNLQQQQEQEKRPPPREKTNANVLRLVDDRVRLRRHVGPPGGLWRPRPEDARLGPGEAGELEHGGTLPGMFFLVRFCQFFRRVETPPSFYGPRVMWVRSVAANGGSFVYVCVSVCVCVWGEENQDQCHTYIQMGRLKSLLGKEKKSPEEWRGMGRRRKKKQKRREEKTSMGSFFSPPLALLLRGISLRGQ
jgi:hypothetical protein